MSFYHTVPAGPAGRARWRRSPLTHLLVIVVVLSLALVTVPCCTLFGAAEAAPLSKQSQHTHGHHDTGHSHSSPDTPKDGTQDHCVHWADANPFLSSGQAQVAPLADSPVWHRTAIANLELLEVSERQILQTPITLRIAYPRLYLLYAHLLL